MINYLELGSSPANEPCVQTTDPDYCELAVVECRRFKALLAAHYAAQHAGRECPVSLRVKSNSHDFGTYYEVAVRFDDRVEAQIEAAYWFEENAPTEWPAVDPELAAALAWNKREYDRRHGRL